MALGPFVLDRSTLGLSVLGSVRDDQQIRAIHEALWPGHTFKMDSITQLQAEEGKKARSRIGDTLIVQTTIRYCKDGLVTNDRGILNGAARVREQFGNFHAYSIYEATAIANSKIQRVRILRASQSTRIWTDELPDWP